MQRNERIDDYLENAHGHQGKSLSPVPLQVAQNFQADAIAQAVQVIQTRYQLFPAVAAGNPQIVIVGVSGGADSICLLDVLRHLAPAWHLDLHVAHLDHALRADSAADAEFVQEVATAWHLPIHRERLAPGVLAAADGSVETAARQARQHFLARLAQSLTPAGQQPLVALAHHADDQAETVLHHLVRGSGLQGLGGMRPSTSQRITVVSGESIADAPAQSSTIAENRVAVIHFVRPLLYVRRATILQHLQQRGLTWREDHTNADQQYTRNYLRHTVLPALMTINPAAVEALGRMATVAADETARLASYDRQLLAALQWPNMDAFHLEETGPSGRDQFRAPMATDSSKVAVTTAPLRQAPIEDDLAVSVGGQLVLDLERLRTLPGATQRALLRQAVALVTPAGCDISFEQVTRFCYAISKADPGGPHPLLADLMWSVAGSTANHPALLSLHRQDVLPFAEGEPLLREGETVALPAVSLGTTARLALTNGWQLTITHLARSALPADWQQRGQPWRAFFDSAHVGRPILTTPTTGQRFAPLGLEGQHKALGDLFTDQKIPVALRRQWPLVVDAATQKILWVCGVQLGYRARVTATTAQVLCLRFEQS